MDSYIRDYLNNSIDTVICNSTDEYAVSLSETNKDFSILHTNIRSILKNFDEFLVFISAIKRSFDIIVLSETWKVQQVDLFEIEGYKMIYNYGDLNQNDGIIVYLKKNIEFTYNVVQIGDIKAIHLELSGLEEKICITAIYRSPSTCPLLFVQELENYLKAIQKNFVLHVIVGDININILQETNYAQEYLNMLSKEGFTSQVNKHTRVQKTQRSCLDHIFTKTYIKQSKVTPIIVEDGITDHFPIILHVNVEMNQQNNLTSDLDQYKRYVDYRAINNQLSSENWDDVYNAQNVEDSMSIFIQKIKYFIAKNTRYVKAIRKTTGRKPWITPGLLKSINSKNDMYMQAKKYPDNELLQQRYKEYKNCLSTLIKQKKKEYYSSKISKGGQNSKTLWKTVNEICNKNGQRGDLDHIKVADDVIDDHQDMANVFNKYFSSIGHKLAQAIKIPKKYKPIDNEIEHRIFLVPTNEAEI